jgi:Tol biopolymer transport system component
MSATPLVSISLLLALRAAFGAWFLGMPIHAGPPPVLWPKPYLIVEAEMDRRYVSDLYVYDLTGKQLKTLTAPPLPTCNAVALSPDGAEVAFVANAMALYILSLRHYSLWAIHPGNASAIAFSHHGRGFAYVAGSFANPREQVVRITGPQRRQERRLQNEILNLDFTPADDQLLATVWRDNRTQIDLIDPGSERTQTLLGESGRSYFLQAVSPDGREILIVCRDLDTQADSLGVLDWSSRSYRTLQTFPRNRLVWSAKYTRDGRHIIFLVDRTMLMADADGKNTVGLTGPIPSSDGPKSQGDGPRRFNRRPPGLLSVGKQLAAYLDWPDKVMLVDLQSRKVSAVNISGAKLHKVFVVE